MNVLDVKNVSKSFTIDGKKVDILKDINFSVKKGEFVSITGSSGSGKSTLLSIIAGLDNPDTGSVKILDKEITKMNEEQISKIRNEDIGFVFQSFYLIPSLTAFENVIFPSELSKKNDTKFAKELIKIVGIDKRENSYPIQLSGGEKQRVAIARSLINKPKILFADEPTGNLDSKNSENIIKLLMNLQKEFDLTLIIVTHEKKVSDMASRKIVIKDGKIISDKKNA